MRFIALALILLSLPIFIALLKNHPHRRGWGMAAMIFMLFLGTGVLRVNASIIGWPLWAGIARGIEITPIDTMAIALLLTRTRKMTLVPLWGLLAFYGFTLLLSLISSAVPLATLFVIWQYIRILLVFAVVANEIDRDDMRRGLYAGLSLGLILEAGFVAAEKFTGVIQAGGTIGHQNTLGMMVELSVLPLIAALMTGDRRWLIRIGTIAALGVMAGGGSRGTMGLGGAGIVVFVLLSLILRPTALKGKIAGLGVLAMMLAVPFAVMTLNARFAGGSFVTTETERAAFERAARAMSADHPFGVGANMYVSVANTAGYSQRAGVTWWHTSRAAPVHNGYLLARAETGWIGEFALILLLLVTALRGLRIAFVNRKHPAGDIALASTVAIGVNIVHNTFEFAVHSYPVQALLILNMALIATQLAAAKRPRRPQVGATARPVSRPPRPEHVPVGKLAGQ